MTIYDVLQRALVAASALGEVTPEQAKVASHWVDLQERLADGPA